MGNTYKDQKGKKGAKGGKVVEKQEGGMYPGLMGPRQSTKKKQSGRGRGK